MAYYEERFRVAIIGGGASAALLISHLATPETSSSFHVDVYDRTRRFGRGIAYSTTHPYHLLNVRASDMSGISEDKEHFVHWIKKYGYGPDDFAPRHLYGDYLESLWAKAENNLSLRSLAEDALASTAMGEGYIVNGRTYDRVILATGNLVPLSPRIKGNPTYYHADPWSIDENLADKKTIGLIGAGLTAVDAILSLLDAGFKGKITVFSRHGLLPRIHLPLPYPWTLPPLKLPLSPLGILRFLRTETRRQESHGVPWQAIVSAMRPITNTLWQSWSDSEKSAFHRHLSAYWGIHRRPMAPSVATIIEKADILCLRSRVDNVMPEGIVTSDGTLHSCDAAINCMGYHYQEPGRQYDVSYKIGPARFGELLETIAIPEIRDQAQAITEDLSKAVASNKKERSGKERHAE